MDNGPKLEKFLPGWVLLFAIVVALVQEWTK
jgi:hypothetical protein